MSATITPNTETATTQSTRKIKNEENVQSAPTIAAADGVVCLTSQFKALNTPASKKKARRHEHSLKRSRFPGPNEEPPNVRVSNISEETTEADLWYLFQSCGRVRRVHVVRNRETTISRGYAYITFGSRENAECAIENFDGKPFDHMILRVDWAKPKHQASTNDPCTLGTTYRSGYGRPLAQDTTVGGREITRMGEKCKKKQIFHDEPTPREKQGGSYIPPHLRAQPRFAATAASGRHEHSLKRSRFPGPNEEPPNVRVSNISEETTEADLQYPFQSCGRVRRVHVVRNRETTISRGYAYITFGSRENAECAIEKLDGKPFDHMILQVDWAKPKHQASTNDPCAFGTTYKSGYGRPLAQDTNVGGKVITRMGEKGIGNSLETRPTTRNEMTVSRFSRNVHDCYDDEDFPLTS